MSKLKEYIMAMTNLYGMVHKDLVLDLYNEQNEDQVTMEAIEAFFTEELATIPGTVSTTFGDYFIQEVIASLDNFVLIIKEKEGIPYYIPNQDELLKYADDTYFEKTKEYNKLCAYLEENFYPNDPENLAFACEHVVNHFRVGSWYKVVMEDYERIGLVFEDDLQYNILKGLVIEVGKNIRMWKYNGHTENELTEQLGEANQEKIPFRKTNVYDFHKAKLEKEDILS